MRPVFISLIAVVALVAGSDAGAAPPAAAPVLTPPPAPQLAVQPPPPPAPPPLPAAAKAAFLTSASVTPSRAASLAAKSTHDWRVSPAAPRDPGGAEIEYMGPGYYHMPAADQPGGVFSFVTAPGLPGAFARLRFPSTPTKLYVLDCHITPPTTGSNVPGPIVLTLYHSPDPTQKIAVSAGHMLSVIRAAPGASSEVSIAFPAFPGSFNSGSLYECTIDKVD